ncbi:MAG: O-acetyl-ADP-ribose deacetylase [Spirochaetales bacterium]|nr:O-acetyl-ADP-ribose deacetylase [Spirochaetales bacterium]
MNAANSSLGGGGGVDGAIHAAGGPRIADECRALRESTLPDGLPTGEAVATTGGDLPARWVIHTVGPVWRGGEAGEPGLLADAYRNALEQARQYALRTVAFPSISTGIYGFPIERAAPIALGAVADVARRHPDAFDEIRFVLFSAPDFATYQQALKTLDHV